MKKYNPKASDVRTGPGGYVRVNLPGFGDCLATLMSFDLPEHRAVQAAVLGWHRGDNIIFWREIPEAARRALWGTLDEASAARAVRVLGLGRDPYPAE